MSDQRDARWMRRALRLASRGQGRTSPNPMVGAVIVKRGREVGEGYHREVGGPHAEVNALRAAGPAARGATLYVTLEPCCHYGRTPPCTAAITQAGVSRVLAACLDPSPRVNGRGVRALRAAGIAVNVGVLEEEACRLNAAYFKLLNCIVVYPVEDIEKLANHKGEVLPDAYIVPLGTTARQLAYRIHTELGDNFIYALEARQKQRVGEDYVLKDRDVLSIISAKKRG